MTAHRIVATADAILSKNLGLGNAKITRQMSEVRCRTSEMSPFRKASARVGDQRSALRKSGNQISQRPTSNGQCRPGTAANYRGPLTLNSQPSILNRWD